MVRDDPAHYNHDVLTPKSIQCTPQLGHQAQVPCCQRTDSNHVNIVFDSLFGCLCRGGEEWPDVNIKTQVGERRRDHLLSSVVSILTNLRDEDPRAPAMVSLE